MADGTELNPGTGGDTIATDAVTDAGVANGQKVQRVKPGYGADNAYKDAAIQAGNVDAATPRVTIATDDVNLAAINASAASMDAKLAAGTVIGDVNNLPKAFVSIDNSTATPLGISGVFTGASWEDISNYSAISLIAFADEASAVDGLVLQYSSDGTNIDHTQSHSVLAGVAFTIQAMKEAKFFRLVYTNGTTAQTVFRLQVIFNPHAGMGEIEQLDQPLNGAADAMLVRAVLAGLQPGGDYANVGITTGGNLKTSTEEISGGLDIGAGNAGAETQRVSISTDDVNLAAINAYLAALSKAEDSIHSSGDQGVMSLVVRNDVLAALVSADGDYAPLQVSAIGALWTHHAPNELEANNSTTTPLGISGVFTGTSTSLLDSSSATVILHSDVDSATDGMQFQFSPDGTNWDVTDTFTYTAADGGRHFQFGAYANFFRVVYTNGTTGQAHLRIQTILQHGDIITSIHRLGDDVSPDRSATVHKSCILAQRGGGGPAAGNYIPVQATAAGNLKVAVEEFDASLPAGTNLLGIVGIDQATANANEVVTKTGSLVALEAGTASIGTLGANSGVDIGDVDVLTLPGVAGDTAHDAADSGNPLKTGAKAVLFNASAPPNAAVSEGDRVNHIADEYGRQYVETTHPNFWDASVDYATAQTNATVKAAPGAGLSLYITDVIISNGATAGNITLLDGSGGSVKVECYPAITGGLTKSLRSPIKLTANTLLALTSTTVTTHTVTVSGFIAP